MATEPKRAILWIIYDFRQGGAELLQIATAAALGAESLVDILPIRGRGPLSDMTSAQVSVLPALVHESSGVARLFSLARRIISGLSSHRRYDVVVGGQDGTAAYMAIILGRLVGSRVVLWNHSIWSEALPDYAWWHRIASRLLLVWADEIVSVSTTAGKDMSDYITCKRPPVRVVPNPYVEQTLSVLPPAAKSTNCVLRLLSIGRLVTSKRFDLAIASVSVLRERGVRARLVILGEGPEKPNLQRQIADMDLVGHVELAGAVTHDGVLEWIVTSDMLVAPSQRESFGLVALEAIANGTPVVAFADSRGLADLLSDTSLGFLVAKRSADSLADGIQLMRQRVLHQLTQDMIESEVVRFRERHSFGSFMRTFREAVLGGNVTHREK